MYTLKRQNKKTSEEALSSDVKIEGELGHWKVIPEIQQPHNYITM